MNYTSRLKLSSKRKVSKTYIPGLFRDYFGIQKKEEKKAVVGKRGLESGK